MRTTIDLPEDAYKLIKALASKRKTTMGTIVAETIINNYGPKRTDVPRIIDGPGGWPIVVLGHPITDEDVREFLDED